MNSRCSDSQRIALGVFLLAFLTVLPIDLRAHTPNGPQQGRPASGKLNTKAPDFILIDQEGNPFESKKLRGKVLAVNFIFTTCSDICPLFTANFAQLQRSLKSENAADVFLVSITTD